MPPERSRRVDRRLAEEVGILFGRARRVWQQVISQAVEGKIESLLEWGMLFCLVREGSGTQNDIAFRVAQHPAAVSRLLEDLEARNLVRRRRDPKDRRKMRVEATSEGRAQVEGSRTVMMAALEEVLRGLDHDDRVALRTLLEKLVAAHEDGRQAPTDTER